MSEDEQLAYMARPGRSMFGVELRVVDDAGTVLPRDGRSSGRLQTRGPGVVRNVTAIMSLSSAMAGSTSAS